MLEHLDKGTEHAADCAEEDRSKRIHAAVVDPVLDMLGEVSVLLGQGVAELEPLQVEGLVFEEGEGHLDAHREGPAEGEGQLELPHEHVDLVGQAALLLEVVLQLLLAFLNNVEFPEESDLALHLFEVLQEGL
jgi:hypothetical protein